MKILCAPVQGVTDCHWRNAQYDIFGGPDGYYGPFMRIEHGDIRKRDIADASPEYNTVPLFTPQILACQPSDALRMVDTLAQMGYNEIDINLGCPFPPIALHHKGSGLLQYPDEVKNLFTALADVEGMRYSVKMRLGWDDSLQWREIVPLFDIINPTQVTVHPRTGRQQYKGDLLIEEFAALLRECHYPVVFNGEIKTLDDITRVKQQFPTITAVMIGHGLIEDPAMLYPEKATSDNYCELHNRLLDAYQNQLNGGDHQLLLKMKSFWEHYLPQAPRKQLKAIKKASSMAKYSTAVNELFYSID
ncbi:MAG: tRNA-dihydrouridine synthase family protein [Muribaculaceae bacterium]|nr:tRNA-dihydrouridine synthase family protein [Muribaculaceae bacterium]